jgi:hypothetical protein
MPSSPDTRPPSGSADGPATASKPTGPKAPAKAAKTSAKATAKPPSSRARAPKAAAPATPAAGATSPAGATQTTSKAASPRSRASVAMPTQSPAQEAVSRQARGRAADGATGTPQAGGGPEEGGRMSDEERQRRIAEAAYHKARERGFQGERHLEDWLEAEREIDEAQRRQR